MGGSFKVRKSGLKDSTIFLMSNVFKEPRYFYLKLSLVFCFSKIKSLNYIYNYNTYIYAKGHNLVVPLRAKKIDTRLGRKGGGRSFRLPGSIFLTFTK